MLTKTGCYFSRVFEQTGSNHWTQPYNHNKTEEEFHEGDLYKEFLARGLRVMIYSGEQQQAVAAAASWPFRARLIHPHRHHPCLLRLAMF